MEWKKGPGRLGIFDPLLGRWVTWAGSSGGPVLCEREFKRILGDAYVQHTARWRIDQPSYEEVSLFGVGPDKRICFWSFTSDGKQSQGRLADVTEIHPQAIGFEADMPGGLARMIYWPAEEEGFHWAVESHTKKGWHRFVTHHYTPA